MLVDAFPPYVEAGDAIREYQVNSFLLIMAIGLITQSEASGKQTGALIIADMQGDVHFLDGENKRVGNGKIEKGDILPPDYFAVTGKGWKNYFPFK